MPNDRYGTGRHIAVFSRAFCSQAEATGTNTKGQDRLMGTELGIPLGRTQEAWRGMWWVANCTG